MLLKLKWDNKTLRLSKTILRKKDRLALSDMKTYYRDLVRDII